MIRNYIIKYSIEFVVIILGITVSFWLNELSISNQNENERIKVLSSLKLEIDEIKFYCDEKSRHGQTISSFLMSFLNPQMACLILKEFKKLLQVKIGSKRLWFYIVYLIRL